MNIDISNIIVERNDTGSLWMVVSGEIESGINIEMIFPCSDIVDELTSIEKKMIERLTKEIK